MYIKTLLLTILLMTAPLLALATESADLKKQIFMDQKKLVVMENMELSDDAAKNFWPVYGKYQEKLFNNAQKRGEVIASYASVYQDMSDSQALELVEDYYRTQDERLALMKQYAKELKTVLPGNKVFRYLQVENKLEAIARFEMAKGIPLAR